MWDGRKQPQKKWATDVNRYSTKEDVWMTSERIKSSTSEQLLRKWKLKQQ